MADVRWVLPEEQALDLEATRFEAYARRRKPRATGFVEDDPFASAQRPEPPQTSQAGQGAGWNMGAEFDYSPRPGGLPGAPGGMDAFQAAQMGAAERFGVGFEQPTAGSIPEGAGPRLPLVPDLGIRPGLYDPAYDINREVLGDINVALPERYRMSEEKIARRAAFMPDFTGGVTEPVKAAKSLAEAARISKGPTARAIEAIPEIVERAKGKAGKLAGEVLGAPVSSAVGEGQARRMYHGTGSAFDTPDAAKFDPNGLYGPGYYLTSNADVASDYARQRGNQAVSVNGRTVANRASQLSDEIARTKALIAQADEFASGVTPQYKRILEQNLVEMEEALASGAGAMNVRAVDVPEGLRLLDVEAPLTASEQNNLIDAFWMTFGKNAADKLKADIAQFPAEKASSLYDSMREVLGGNVAVEQRRGYAQQGVNGVLRAAGYDGIRYSGGQIMPLQDAAGKAIEHEAVVIFPESLPKLRNALSGTMGGLVATDESMPSLRGAVTRGAAQGAVGGATAEMQQEGATPESMALAGLEGAGLGAGRAGLSRVAPGAGLRLGGQVARLVEEGATGANAAAEAANAARTTGPQATLPARTAGLSTPQSGIATGKTSGSPPSGAPPRPVAASIPPAGGPGKSFLHPPRSAGFEQFWNRARNVIASQGPAGEELARLIRLSRDTAETTAGQWVYEMETVRGLSKNLFDNFVDVAEGKAAPANATVEKAAREWERVRTAIYNQAKSNGLDIGKIADYFPHRYDPKTFEGRDNWTRSVEHLLDSGQAATVEQAEQILYRARDAVHGKQKNLEVSRIANLPEYERTKEALLGYVEGAAKRIAEARWLGPESEKALALITKIGEQGGDTGAVKNLLQISLGTKEYGEIAEQISRVARAYSTFTKLGRAAIGNASQSINTATVTGIMRTITRTPEAMSPEGREFALRIGATLDGVIKDVREGSGMTGKLAQIAVPGFNTVEKFNRTLAAVAGRDYARELAAKAAKGDQGAAEALRKLGLMPQAIIVRGGKLSPGEEIQAARSIVERTQFKVDPQDLPGWMDSPMGKLAMQFRTFSYNQTAFMGREVIQPALKGDVRPLVRWLLLAPASGAAVVELNNLITNRPSEEDPAKRILEYYTRVGSFGIVGDLIRGFMPPNTKYLPNERYALQAASTIAGPTLGTVIEGLGTIPSTLKGDPVPLERFALKQIPFFGQPLKNTLLPYKPGGRAGTPAPAGRPTHPGRPTRGGLVHPGR